jgi:hypothetical protein
MLYKLLKIDDTSKRSAIKVSIFNLILTFIITLVLNIMIYFIFQWYDESTAKPVSRLVWVEVGLNILFFPFAILLIMGIRKDKYKWIRIWIKAKVVQASYIFLLNVVMQVYITSSLNVDDGLIVLLYTMVLEAIYMESIIFMNNYHRYRESENKNPELPTKVDIKDSVIKV